MEAVAVTFRRFVEKREAEFRAEIEKRVAAVESKTFADAWAGTFDETSTYRRGAVVTHQGSLWLALATTREVPGDGETSWRLIVKRGSVR